MNCFWLNSIFCNFKNGQKSIFELGKNLKLLEMQFHEKKKKIYYLISRVFCLDFFRFSGPLMCTQTVPLSILISNLWSHGQDEFVAANFFPILRNDDKVGGVNIKMLDRSFKLNIKIHYFDFLMEIFWTLSSESQYATGD